MKRKLFICLFLFLGCMVPNIFYTDVSIAPYILDGSLVLYFPNIKEAASAWKIIYQKTMGAEYQNVVSKIEFQIREKMSINIFDAHEAESIGIDPNKALSYVHLRQDLGYFIFTVGNERLLRNTLDQLTTPVPYRIEGKFIIFSASIEILEYYQFKGLESIAEFQHVAKAVQFNWKQKFIWMDSSYFTKTLLPFTGTTIPQGNRIAGTFDVNDKNIMLNLYTWYDDPAVDKLLKNSMQIKPVQKLSFLDFEFGNPAVVGQMYLNLQSFIQAVESIDKIDNLNLNKLFTVLKKNNIDLQQELIPYIQGRTSYVLRSYDPFQKELKFTLTAEINNPDRVKEFFNRISVSARNKGGSLLYKDLFTQQFFGWKFQDFVIWFGIAEGHLVVSSDEQSMITLIRNIYEAKNGFLNKLPPSFKRSVVNKVIGGQTYISVPEMLQNIHPAQTIHSFSFFSALKSISWDFSLVEKENQIGRYDFISLEFF